MAKEKVKHKVHIVEIIFFVALAIIVDIAQIILDLFGVSLGRTALKKILKLLWQARTEQLHVYR